MLISYCWFFLSRHLDFFEMVRNEDDSELAKRFDMVSNVKLISVPVLSWMHCLKYPNSSRAVVRHKSNSRVVLFINRPM